MKTYCVFLLVGLITFMLSCNHADLIPSIGNENAAKQLHSSARIDSSANIDGESWVPFPPQIIEFNSPNQVSRPLFTLAGGLAPALLVKLIWVDNSSDSNPPTMVLVEIDTRSSEIKLINATIAPGNILFSNGIQLTTNGAVFSFDRTAGTLIVTTLHNSSSTGKSVSIHGTWQSTTPAIMTEAFTGGPKNSRYGSVYGDGGSIESQLQNRLQGTVIGSNGSSDGISTRDRAFDGKLDTWVDVPSANGQWVGLDLGTPKNFSRIIFRPRKGWEKRMEGGKFQISSEPTFANPLTLYTIPGNPPIDQNEAPSYINLQNYEVFHKGYSLLPGAYTDFVCARARYFRYLSPSNGWGNVGEIILLP